MSLGCAVPSACCRPQRGFAGACVLPPSSCPSHVTHHDPPGLATAARRCRCARDGLTLCDSIYATTTGKTKLSLQQLSEQSDVAGRTIRFYIQKGLLPAPAGSRRGAWYGEAHLADLLRIRQWQDTGLSLEAIAGLLSAQQEPPVAPSRPGAVEVRSHLVVADGVEFVVAPDRAGLSQEQIRRLFHPGRNPPRAKLCKRGARARVIHNARRFL